MSNTKFVIVVRHGERKDYVMRDSGENWLATAQRPWDPPLTYPNGFDQAKDLGLYLAEFLEKHKLPPISAFYSSPFLRCRQTAHGIAQTYGYKNSSSTVQVQIELGLAESINENWYRSWALPGADGSWGYKKKECPELDPQTFHPASKEPVQPLLEWKTALSDATLSDHMDHDHVSKTSLSTPFSLHPPKFESSRMQQERMVESLTQLSDDHPGQTIVMVSHGKSSI
jgi:broad specificity phosphatase PhoE